MITSTSNTRMKRLVNLRKKRRARDEEGVFLVEGIRMFREVPPDKLQEVFVSESFYKKEKETVEKVLARGNIRAELVSDTVFSHISDTKTPQGILCVVKQMDHTLNSMIKGEQRHLLVLDNLQDPGNLGTIVRTAEGAGVNGVIMSADCVDIYNPKTIRSTMGSVYRMPFCYAENLEEAIEKIKEAGIHTYAAHLLGENDYDQEDYRTSCAFFIGNEGNGLREEIAQAAQTYVKIPMSGQVESLNAAIAASVLMFEVRRQRKG